MRPELRQAIERRRIDAALGALATVFGLVSLSYPFARDQGLFFYGAREWLLRGQVLYRDFFDHKPPGIYAAYAVAIGLFGQNAWGIRLLELAVAVPGVAWVSARLATARGERIPSGVFGAAWMGAAIVQYGYLSFYDTAQCEIWFTLLAIAGLAAAVHMRSPRRAGAVAGVLSALAFFVKPPSVPFVLITVVAMLLRARREVISKRETAIQLGMFTLTALLTSGLVIGYFAAKHALPQMIDLLVGLNQTQVRSGPGVHNLGDLVSESVRFFHDYEPFSTLLLAVAVVTAVRGWMRRDLALAARYALPLALTVACWVSVAMQRKFYLYHRASIIAAVAVAFALVYQDCQQALAERRRWLPIAFAVSVGLVFVLSGDPALRWQRDVREAVAWKLGAISREEFTRRYDIPGFYAFHDSELAGLWLRAHASPDDTLVVRGFETQIYESSGLHYTGRFCWSSFLDEPGREYFRRDEWLAEDLGELREHPPHWAVAFDRPGGITSAPFFEGLGYVRRAQFGVFVVLEHSR